MILSRSKPATESRASTGSSSAKKSFPELEDFVLKRDYVGALTMLEFLKHEGNSDVWPDVWSAWCWFHLGEYRRALDVYQRVRTRDNLDARVSDYIAMDVAVCYFYLGMYQESQEAVEEAPKCSLKTRLLFHLAHKLGDEESLMKAHATLRDVPEDQLCLASVHYLRAHYQEAIDVYKKLLLDRRYKRFDNDDMEWIKMLSATDGSYMALNVYVALCYYKLDYYDVSQEVLGVYLAQHPTSTVAGNLKACNLFRLYNGKAAENELKQMTSDQHTFGQDLVKHNLVVFRNGEGALKVLPELVDVVPEARLNLAGYRLRNREAIEARTLLEPLQPTSPLHYILRAVVAVKLYNDTGDDEQLKLAQQSFHLVGSSASECDTIPGRQCMASSYFLAGHYEEVLVYLNSIKSFFVNDDTFNFNYAQAKVATGFYREAEESLLSIQDEGIRNSFTFLACLCRCHVMNKDAALAWDICVKSAGTPDSFALLQLVANDSYRMGQFLFAAKAFHMLDRLDGGPEMWEGLRGAVCGCAQAAAANRPNAAAELREALALLKGPRSHTRADNIVRTITKWAQQNRIPV
ncbi:intraflagellar transport protein 56 isoform X1 [Spodoptera frugiperda]|uniref:Intraflagellar transport protein 56 isoform X1 n=1 Tax=Spodoptera frugiperda TaxID=7108 RepID=A0A9R0CXR6_SPOFR|nr:intraflagellar transport protein 56 isoform X1 [Spodoptera frugiperda]